MAGKLNRAQILLPACQSIPFCLAVKGFTNYVGVCVAAGHRSEWFHLDGMGMDGTIFIGVRNVLRKYKGWVDLPVFHAAIGRKVANGAGRSRPKLFAGELGMEARQLRLWKGEP